MNKKAVIIGGGFGGLAAALRCKKLGFDVTLVERLDMLGGRARVFQRQGYRHDAGPTVITAPFLFEELFALYQENLKDYGARVTGIIKSYGGKPLVRGGKFETLEGQTYPRTVIWEFPNHEQAIKCHDSKEYQDGWAIARDTTERNLQIVEGFSTE